MTTFDGFDNDFSLPAFSPASPYRRPVAKAKKEPRERLYKQVNRRQFETGRRSNLV